MKNKFSRFFAFLLILVMTLTGAPVALAAPAQEFSASGGWTNPVYEGRVQEIRLHSHALSYYGTEAEVTYITDAEEASAAIREGMELRRAEIPLHYIIPEILPDDQTEMEERLEEIVLELWDGAFIETDQPTEGDSLQYAWRQLGYGFSGTAYPALGYTEADLTFHVTYYTDAAQEQELTEAVDELVASFGFTEATTDREKVDAIYGWLCENVTYDYDNLNDESYILKFTAYAAMVHKTAVCEGYAVLFYRLAEECGLDARVIVGTAGANSENHAWNIVKLGDYYYYVDSTWDAGSTPADYEYYLKGHADFYGHTNDPQFDTAEFRERYPIPEQGLTTSSSTVFEAGDWKFIISNGLAVITEYTGNATAVTVPAGLTITAYVNGVLGDYTFPVHSVAGGVFSQNDTVESITLSEGVAQLRPGAIEYCDNLKELHLPSTLKMENYGFSSITEAPESCYELQTLTVAEGNPYITLIDGVLYTADRTTLLYCAPKNGVTEVTVPEGVEVVGSSAFHGHATLQKLILPASVKDLGHFSLQSTPQLQELQMPGIERIGQYAIAQSGLQNLALPATLYDLWHGALYETELQTVTVDPANETYYLESGILIGDGIAHKFALGTQIEQLTVPADVTAIEESAFANADQLKEITFPAGLKEIGDVAFDDCDALEHVTLPDGLEDLGDYAFSSCDMLVSVLIPASVTAIGHNIHTVAGQADNITVYGAEGSAAQTYAEETGRTFKTVDQFVCTGGHTLVKTMVDEYTTEMTDVFDYICSVCGDHTQRFTFIYKDFSAVTCELEYEEFTYTGQPHRPAVYNVKDAEGNPLTEGVHYEVLYGTNTDVSDHVQIWINPLMENYRKNKYFIYYMQPADISEAEISVDTPEFEYDATSKYPEVTVIWNGNPLTKYDDFGLSYEDNKEPGTAYVTVNGARNFTGSVRLSFTIKEHTHRWGAWMSADDTQHARQCLDTFCREWAYADHNYDNVCDTECNTCHHIREVPHVFTDTYDKNGADHWLICDLCGEPDVTSIQGHTGGTATCEQKKECAVCGQEYGDLDSHTLKLFWDEACHWTGCENCDYIQYDAKFDHYGSAPGVCGERKVCNGCGQEFGEPLAHRVYTANDENYHWDACLTTGCAYKENVTAHSGGNATCMKQATCEGCGKPYGNKGEHNMVPAYTETKHYEKCSVPGCNQTTPKEDHTGGNATCTEKAVCEVCDRPYGAEPSHDLELIANPGSVNHYYDCKNCDHTEGGEKHYGGTATCQNKPVCDLCGIEYGGVVSHSMQSGWTAVSGGHAHLCKWCGTNNGVYPHSGGNATCKSLAVCVTCNTAYGSLGGHRYDNACDSTCNTCGTSRSVSHSYGAYVYNNDATAASDGTQTRRCTICGNPQTVTAPGTRLQNPFTDVPMEQYYATPVLWAVERGITNGMSATSFAPDATCTRGQIVTFLWRAAGKPEPQSSYNPFADVPSDQYYYKAVLWAVEQGITNGMSATSFAPDASCTRGQIVTFLWRAKGKPSVTSANPFADVSSNAYYYNAVLWAVKNGITNGMSANSFGPEAPCTRGQIVTFLYRAYN